MGEIVSYMLQVALVMTLLYLPYKWMLSTSTFHKLNRALLLTIYIVSWSLPALMAAWASRSMAGGVEVGFPISVSVVDAPVAETKHAVDWFKVIVYAYLSGVALTAIMTLAGAARMFFIITSGRKAKRDGYIEVISSKAPGPFSWGRYVVIRPEDTDGSYQMVVDHEKAHLRHLHWLDLLPGQITVILQWFSPAAWLMLRELKDVHEFQVDQEVASDDPAEYQMMLLKKTVGTSFPVLADSLNHSQIKKRITMMMSQKSRRSRTIAAVALPAFAALSVFTLSQPAVARITSRVASVSLTSASVASDKVSESSADSQPVLKIRNAATADAAAESAAIETISIAAAGEEPAKESTPQAPVADQKPAYFVDGKLFTGNINDLNSDDIKAMVVVKNDPEYPQGKIMIDTKSSKAPSISEEDKTTGTHLAPEKIAEYKGGMMALRDLVKQNVKNPVEVGDKPVRVIVQFTISADGKVSDPKVMRSGGEAFDAEALRLVELTSGNWEPAQLDGKPVASQFTMPVSFTRPE